MKAIALALTSASLWLAAMQTCLADGHDRGRGHRPEWRGEIGRFHDHDIDLWRGGRWRHGHHDGRLGWWWIVGGVWYFYPSRIDPYPDPYLPPAATVGTPSVGQYWYYCANPPGYYPYVPQCAVAWQAVAVTPQPAPVMPAYPPPR